jgi:acyl-CoA hydrolase/RimJ/RimL family protein N-acetyltransferase
MHAQKTISSLSEILPHTPRNSRIFIGSGCAEPQELVRQLVHNFSHFADAEILHLLTAGGSEYVQPKYAHHFRHNAFFIGPNVRDAVAKGEADYTPIFLSELPGLFESRQMPVDLALIQVSPPDAHGYCSLGVSVDVVKSAAAVARTVVAQVNPHMPRTLGDSLLHSSQIHYLLEYGEPILELKPEEPDAEALQIGAYIARLISDGATLQMGIGGIPNAVLKMLGDKNDLGIHTEMFSDGVVPLVRKGVINGKRKTLHTNKIVTSFVMGSKLLYDFVHDNPGIEFHPSQYTNDPFTISRNHHMVAINSALQVDLTGQVCADSLGPRFFSGIGGQVDYIRGAARSPGGKPIIALPSTAKNGKLSRIVADLHHGAGVTTSRGDVHYVVTEYGIAFLYGKSVRQRALELINIAHPDFRGELLDAMKARHYVYPDQKLETIGRLYPQQYETVQTFKEAGAILFRPIKPTDERMLQDFFYSHSEETIFMRYHAMVKTMPHEKAQYLVNVDYKSTMAFIGVVGEIGKERIIAIGRYISSPTSNFPEVAFVVHEAYRCKGIARFLLQQLTLAAKNNGYEGFVAYVLPENTAMLYAFDRVGGIERKFDDGIFKVTIRFKDGVG